MKTNLIINRLLKRAYFQAIFLLALLPSITNAQYLTGVDPDTGQQGQVLELMISGQNTNFAQATYVSISLQQGTSSIVFPFSVTVENDELVKAVFNFTYSLNTGLYDLAVFSPPDNPMYLEDAFTLLPGSTPPEITQVDPSTAETGQTLDIMISGQYTHFQASSTTVWFSQGSLTIFPNYNQVISDTEIKSNFTFQYYHPEGFYDVNTFNETDGHLTLSDGFLLSAGPVPHISALEPSQGMAGTYIEFHISGENTHFQDATQVDAFLQNNYGGVNLPVEIINNENMTASLILPYSLGNFQNTDYYLYVFTDLDGPMFLYSAFSALQNPAQPYISHIEPDSTYLGNTVIIEAFTENTFFTWPQFLFVTLERDDWNFPVIQADNIAIDDDEKLTAAFTIPSDPAVAGLWDFVITNVISGELVVEGAFSVIDTITVINEKYAQNAYQVFPNPTTDYINISATDNTDYCMVVFFNLAGQQMDMKRVKFEAGIPVRFNIDRYPTGIYTVKIITQNEIIVKKIIKN